MKTSELIGPALDWAVAKCEGETYDGYRVEEDGLLHAHFCGAWLSHPYDPTTDWSQAGPIIDRKKIMIKENGYGHWFARIGKSKWMRGPTARIAAMRCHIASELGDEVEIPEELK